MEKKVAKFLTVLSLAVVMAAFGACKGSTGGAEVSADWYVDADATGLGTGLTWADAFTAIQDAMDAATDEDVIFVADGIYTRPAGAASEESVLVMKDGVDIYGGFAGTESLLSERVLTTDESILDGEDESYHVVLGASDASLDGFTVAYGYAYGAVFADQIGGGMLNYDVLDLTVNYCLFYDNYAFYYGGGMTNDTAILSISNSIFDNNYAYYGGGGLASYYTYLTVSNSDFTYNDSYGDGGAIANHSYVYAAINDSVFEYNYANSDGGAIATYYAYTSINDSVFENNVVLDAGGAVYNYNAYSIIGNSVFEENYTVYSDGGAIYNGYTDAIISNSIFDDNYAYSDGGAIANWGADPVISNSIFYYNDSWDTGGAMYNVYSDPTISNSLFYENETFYYGGAIYNWESDPTIGNSTFTDNYAYYYGGALANYYYSYPSISDSILYDDYAFRGYNEIYDWGNSATTIIYSDIMGGHAGTGNIDADPLFVGDFFLDQDDSPCVDAGSDTAANLDMDDKTTSTTGAADTGDVDMGFHHEIP